MIAALVTTAVLALQQAAPQAVAPPGTTISPAEVTAPKPKAAEVKKNQLICRDEPVLGTLFPKRVCATRSEITERQRWDQKDTRESTNLRPWKDPGGL